MSLRQLPNLLCVLRIVLVYPVAAGVLQQRHGMVLVLFALAAFTDALDGFLAKRFGWSSELGKVLDPLADKLMLMTVFVCLSITGLSPWWLATLVILRDLVILSGALTFKRLFGPLRGAPTVVSKLNTLCQVTYCLAVIATAGYGWPGTYAVNALGALVLLTTAISGIDYVLVYARRAAQVARERVATTG